MSKNISTKFLLSFLLLSLISLTKQDEDIPKITVYVESLCPDCVEFITGSFKTFHQKVTKENVVDVEFIPFGNAKESYNEKTKKYDFTCQHGENECYGNLIETCAINIMGKQKSYDTIICIEGNIASYSKNFDKTLEYCLKDDQDNLALVKECVTSDIGNTYQHIMAMKTEDHKWVPWIMVDGVHDVAVEEQILSSLYNYVCGEDESKCK